MGNCLTCLSLKKITFLWFSNTYCLSFNITLVPCIFILLMSVLFQCFVMFVKENHKNQLLWNSSNWQAVDGMLVTMTTVKSAHLTVYFITPSHSWSRVFSLMIYCCLICFGFKTEYNIHTGSIWNFKILASLCSWADWFGPYLGTNSRQFLGSRPIFDVNYNLVIIEKNLSLYADSGFVIAVIVTTCKVPTFLTSLFSLVGWIEHYLVKQLENTGFRAMAPL